MKNRILTSIIFISVAIVIFILSYDSIWIIDCITYQYNFATGEKIQGISDIFESQYVHYFTWNGRYVAHWLCQLFLPILGKPIFSAANALMYIALIMLVLKNSTREAITLPRVLTATCIVLLLCDTEYIPPCQIGYIWMAVVVLLYIYLFFNFASSPTVSAWHLLWLLPVSVISGNAQEAINIGVGGALILFVLMNVRQMTIGRWCMFVGFGIGGLFLCLSPATIGRTQEMVTTPVYSAINFLLTLRVAYLLVIILIYKISKHQLTFRDFYKNNAFYINSITVLLIFNFIIGVGGNRQLFGVELFSGILVIRVLKNQSFPSLALWVFLLLIVGIYALKYKEIKKSDKVYKEVSAQMASNPDGPIFMDFPKFNPYIHSTTVFRYGVYLDYALNSIHRELTGNRSGKDFIQCYPTIVEKKITGTTMNQSYEYLPGEFVMMQDRNSPGSFWLHRSLCIFGLRIYLPPYQVDFDTHSHLNTGEYNIQYLPEIMPFIVNEGITIDQ